MRKILEEFCFDKLFPQDNYIENSSEYIKMFERLKKNVYFVYQLYMGNIQENPRAVFKNVLEMRLSGEELDKLEDFIKEYILFGRFMNAVLKTNKSLAD